MSRDNLDKKLDQFSRFFVTPTNTPADTDTDRTLETSPSYPERYYRLADTLGGELIDRDSGAYCLVRTLYPWGEPFGSVVLERPDNNAVISRSAFSSHDCDGCAPVPSLLCFDTETTGLGGSGAVAFLIGFGSLTDNGFEVRQYVLPDYSDETAMLEDVLAECTDDRTLVSYNGAAFDVPVVRDRMIINRVSRHFEPAGHIDLLHPTRRLFRRRLRDCTLTNIERELFAFYRDDDIPGYLIPSVYFEWLGEESLEAMEQVLEHNRLDILTLYFLSLHINTVFASEGASLDRADDIHSLSRVFGRRRQHEQVIRLYRSITETSEKLAGDALLYHSLMLKRSGQMEEAVELWESLLETDSREAYTAAIELAKYCEHRLKDCPRALAYTRRAVELRPDSDAQWALLERRLLRLKTKVGDSGQSSDPT
ncbi:hypothetical protein GF420_15595 [candidate division GN15 bacterium]|nr:hypothetical protein [candidate division GN15 bacterium]